MSLQEYVLIGSVALVGAGWLVAVALSIAWLAVRGRIQKNQGDDNV